MRGIVPDANVVGQCGALAAIWNAPPWRDLWNESGLLVVTFEELQLPAVTVDSTVWQRCQDEQLVLVTGNRNDDGPDSLETTIRLCVRPESLPVITMANPNRVTYDRDYTQLVAERVLDVLLYVDDYRGVGRLYVP